MAGRVIAAPAARQRRWNGFLAAGRDYWLLTLVFVASLVEILLVPPSIHGDGVGYYAYLRSVSFDGDLHFANEFRHFGQATTLQMIDRGPTPTGLVHNIWSVGPAILWSPFFALGHVAALLLARGGWSGSPDGYSEPYVYSVAVGSAVYAFLGLLLTYRLLRAHFSLFPALVALAGVWFATSLTAYMYFHPSLSHPVSFFLVSGFFYLWWTGRVPAPAAGRMSTPRHQATKEHERFDGGFREIPRAPWWLGALVLTSSVRRVCLGVCLGLMVSARPQNALYLVPVLGYEAWLLVGSRPRAPLDSIARWVGNWALVGLIALLAFTPQMAAWWTLYGKLVVNPYAEFHGAAGFSWLSPRIWEVLFSSRHGLVSWTPAVGLGLIGLALAAARGTALARVLGVSFLIQLYLVAAWSNWWQGASFGGRMFIELTPAFALGLATLVGLARGKASMAAAVALVLLLSVWNLLFILQYGSGALPLEGEVDWGVMVGNQVGYAPRLMLAMVAPARLGPLVGLIALAAAVGAAAFLLRARLRPGRTRPRPPGEASG